MVRNVGDASTLGRRVLGLLLPYGLLACLMRQRRSSSRRGSASGTYVAIAASTFASTPNNLHLRLDKMANRKGKPRPRDSAAPRAKSEELGEGDLATKRNPRTGRPIRESAGKRQSDSVFVNSLDAVDDDEDDPFFYGPEDNEGNAKKRKRTPSPPPPGLDNVAIDEFKRYRDDPRELDSARSPTPDPTFESYRPLSVDAGDKQPEPETINVTLNIPPGFSGPVHLSIDRNMLHAAKRQRQNSDQPRMSPRGKTSPAQTKSKSKDEASAAQPVKENLILKLPPELRIKIMKNLFVVKGNTCLLDTSNFSRSSAFLRTCKKIHDEGCELLYGSNHFWFYRNTDHRTPLWSSTKKEVGYHDFRLWLHTIGPVNIAVSLSLPDLSVLLTFVAHQVHQPLLHGCLSLREGHWYVLPLPYNILLSKS